MVEESRHPTRHMPQRTQKPPGSDAYQPPAWPPTNARCHRHKGAKQTSKRGLLLGRFRACRNALITTYDHHRLMPKIPKPALMPLIRLILLLHIWTFLSKKMLTWYAKDQDPPHFVSTSCKNPGNPHPKSDRACTSDTPERIPNPTQPLDQIPPARIEEKPLTSYATYGIGILPSHK